MKILVITQYYPPEPGAPSNRLKAFVEAMTRRGHDVTVICEMPNYPRGKLAPENKHKLFRIENNGIYRIIRTYVLVFEKKNNIKRIMFYLSFALSSFIAGLLVKRHDVVFTSSPPIFHAFMAMLVAKIKRSKFILDIRDLWPDTVTEVEAMSNGIFMKLARYLERQLYSVSKLIFCTTTGIKKRVVNRGGKDKSHIIYNGSEKSILEWMGDMNEFRHDHGWDNKIVILYAGIIGIGQNLTKLVPYFSNFGNDVIFVFIGDGPQKVELQSLINKLSVSNVILYDTMSFSKVIPFLCSADILLAILRETKLFEITIPSKFFDCMAAGKPVITNVDGETRYIMEHYNTGKYFTLKKPESFKIVLESLIRSPEQRESLGNNGRELVKEKFLRSRISEEAIRLIEQLKK